MEQFVVISAVEIHAQFAHTLNKVSQLKFLKVLKCRDKYVQNNNTSTERIVPVTNCSSEVT